MQFKASKIEIIYQKNFTAKVKRKVSDPFVGCECQACAYFTSDFKRSDVPSTCPVCKSTKFIIKYELD